MRRWNGWGDSTVETHLADGARAMLEELVGKTTPPKDATLEDCVRSIPNSRLSDHPLVSQDLETRLRHARGQSFPDWVALRSGNIGMVPDGVAFPESIDDVRKLMVYAKEQNALIIPYGGGTSVVGHLTVPKGERSVLSVSMARFNQLIKMDTTNQLATFGAGVTGPDLEAALRAQGYTLGHYPQSFEYSTLGGWVVTRSSGQQSLGFGRIEDMFAGGMLHCPSGELYMPNLPASAAGPDLRQQVLGSEGRMGILSEVSVRVQQIPEAERFHAVFFPNWDMAESAVRAISQSGLPLSMMRLSNAIETQTNLTLAGKERLVKYLKQFLELRKVKDDGCMLLLGFSGDLTMIRSVRNLVLDICRSHKGVHVFKPLGKAWSKNRFKTPYVRNTLWDLGYAVDTLETCVTWDQTTPAMNAIEDHLRNALSDEGEQTHVFTHLSHFYSSGCSIYTTYLFRLGATPEESLARWRKLKVGASNVIAAHGGTISHQHGVGEDHKNWLAAEKTKYGVKSLAYQCKFYDPEGVMNPGKLLD